MEVEEQIWQSGALGEKDPQTLLYTVFYLIGINFTLHSGSEHCRLGYTDSQLQLVCDGDHDNDLCLVYREDISRTIESVEKWHAKLLHVTCTLGKTIMTICAWFTEKSF